MAIKFAAKDQPKPSPAAPAKKQPNAPEPETGEALEVAAKDLFNSETKTQGRKPKSK